MLIAWHEREEGGESPIGANLRDNSLDLNDISAIIVQNMVLSSRDLQNLRFAPSQSLGFVNARDPYSSADS